MSSLPEPAIWSHDTGQWIPQFDSGQLSIRWMSNIKHVAMVMVLLSYFSKYWAWCTDVRMDSHVTTQTFKINGLPNFLRYGALLEHIWYPGALLLVVSKLTLHTI